MYNLPTSNRKKESKLASNLKGFFYAILIAIIIRIVLIEPYKIPSESMYPSIHKGDMIMAGKFTYGIFFPIINLKISLFNKPSAGDIALFQSPTYISPGKIKEFINFITFGVFMLDNNESNPKFFIKRVVAEPGSIVQVVNPKTTSYQYQLVVNGEKLLLNPLFKKPDFKEADEYLFFTEQFSKKDRIVQYRKEENSLFSFSDNGFQGSIYLPKKGDILEFRMTKQKESKNDIKKALELNMSPSFHQDDEIQLIVFRERSEGHLSKVNAIVMDIPIFNNFYYTGKPANTLLSDKQAYELLLKGSIKIIPSYGYYLMMGDNRDNSSDSRYWGFVTDKYFIGSPLIRYFPFSRFGSVNLSLSKN